MREPGGRQFTRLGVWVNKHALPIAPGRPARRSGPWRCRRAAAHVARHRAGRRRSSGWTSRSDRGRAWPIGSFARRDDVDPRAVAQHHAIGTGTWHIEDHCRAEAAGPAGPFRRGCIADLGRRAERHGCSPADDQALPSRVRAVLPRGQLARQVGIEGGAFWRRRILRTFGSGEDRKQQSGQHPHHHASLRISRCIRR